jgi:hypothetical protein
MVFSLRLSLFTDKYAEREIFEFHFRMADHCSRNARGEYSQGFTDCSETSVQAFEIYASTSHLSVDLYDF